MTEYDEIVQLRKSGQYDEAYEKVKMVVSNNPEYLWGYNQLGWCLRERMKRDISSKQYEASLCNLQEIADINKKHPLDSYIIKAIAWSIREFVANCTSPTLYPDRLNAVFAIMQQIDFPSSDENYHILLQPFLKAKQWDGLKSVIEWWGIDNLKPSDYVPYTKDNGQKIMSFAEQVLIAYSRILLNALSEKKFAQEEARLHIKRLEAAAIEYPQLQYPRYFQAQLMLALGDNDGVVDILLPFVRKKQNDYWVWELLGDAVSDKQLSLACFCKALSCHVKESFLRKLFFKTCDAFLSLEKWSEAKAMLKRGVEISRANNWQMPYKYENYMYEEWYQQTSESTIDNKFYKEYTASAERLLYSDKPKRVIVVTFVNKEKQVMNFLTEKKEEGFVRYSNLLKKPRVGMILKCSMEKVNQRWRVYDVVGEKDTKAYEGKLILNTNGIIRKKNNEFGFIGQVYVPKHLASGFPDGQTVSSVAIPQFNNSKGEWSWRAISVF